MPTVRRMKTKLTLLGEGGVGKTSLIRRFVLNEYQETYLHTVGTRVSKIELAVPYGADVEVQMDLSIFDIMGQRGFKDLVRETYFHGTQALMAVSDITREDSLYALNEWIPLAIEIVDRAFRTEEARAVDRGLREKVLELLAKRGALGLKKNQFFEILRGVNFDELQAELKRLEAEGLLTLLWAGPADFTAVITPRGTQAGQARSGSFEE